jgi:hypothetical protein
VQEISLAAPDVEPSGDEASVQEAFSASDRSRSSNQACTLCPSTSRRIHNLHSSVLVTFDESDLDSNMEDHRPDIDAVPISSSPQRCQSGPGPQPTDTTDTTTHMVAAANLSANRPRATGPKCMSRLEDVKPGLIAVKGGSLQELKTSQTNKKAIRFGNSCDNSAGEDSKKTGDEALRLPKLETSKQRAASMGGSLSVGGVSPQGPATSSTGCSLDVNKPSHIQFPHTRRAHNLSASSPGDIISDAFDNKTMS